MKTVVFPSTNPNVKGEMEARFVLWVDDVDVAPNEYQAYTNSNSLPTMAIIDPGGNPNRAVKVQIGAPSTESFYQWLRTAQPAVGPVWLSDSSLAGIAGGPISYQSRATRSPTGWRVSGPPTFVQFDMASGALSGEFPPTPGTWTFNLTADSSTGSATQTLSLTSYPPGVSAGGNASWTWLVSSRRPGSTGRTLASGAIQHSQQSDLVVDALGPGTMSFWANVSSEEGYDFFRVLVDDAEKLSRSGVLNTWQQHSVSIPAGPHRVVLRYLKDYVEIDGRDNIWIDSLVLPPLQAPADLTHAVRSATVSGGALRLQWRSVAGSSYFIQQAPSVAGPWSDVLGSQTMSAGQTESALVPMPAGWESGFFRVRRMSGL